MELRQAEPFGVLDHHHRGVRHVDADFHDRRGDEHVQRPAANARMTRSFSSRLHPAVQQRDLQIWKDVARKMLGHGRGGLEVDFL